MTALINWEFKNEMAQISHTPILSTGQNYRSPMLPATVVGCQVFGAFWDGSSVDPLSGTVSLLLMPKDPRRGQEEVARVLSSLNSAIDDLYKVEDKEEGLHSCDLGPLDYRC